MDGCGSASRGSGGKRAVPIASTAGLRVSRYARDPGGAPSGPARDQLRPSSCRGGQIVRADGGRAAAGDGPERELWASGAEPRSGARAQDLCLDADGRMRICLEGTRGEAWRAHCLDGRPARASVRSRSGRRAVQHRSRSGALELCRGAQLPRGRPGQARRALRCTSNNYNQEQKRSTMNQLVRGGQLSLSVEVVARTSERAEAAARGGSRPSGHGVP